jgi:DNA topoisomerase-1
VTAPIEAARAAALRYVTDGALGIVRRNAGAGFRYVGPSGRPVRDEATLRRIRSLAIPPAWTDVWICPSPEGHLQATGRDARGRKQYRYHQRWRDVRDENKYGRMVAFGGALPRIRRAVQRDLARFGLSRERVLATVVRLLETTLIRVGNEEYARANNSFGLTTLQNRHVAVRGERVHFRFRGKGGKAHAIAISDARLARLVRRIRELPGQEMFQYLDGHGRPVSVSSDDVNAYLRRVSGEDFTAKDFRTWAGSLEAARGLAAVDEPGDVKAVVARVAAALGNTAAVARKCYIHPLVLEAWRNPALLRRWRRGGRGGAPAHGLSAEESALLRFLAAPPPDPFGPAQQKRRSRKVK